MTDVNRGSDEENPAPAGVKKGREDVADVTAVKIELAGILNNWCQVLKQKQVSEILVYTFPGDTRRGGISATQASRLCQW